MNINKTKSVPSWILLASVAVGLVAAMAVGYAAAGADITPMNSNPTFCNTATSVFVQAPVSGWEYFAVYNTTTGFISSINAQPYCQIQPSLQRLGISPTNQAAVDSQLLGIRNGDAALNVTSSSTLLHLSLYINAFYVSIQTQTLSIKPGISFEGSTAYYNGELITNGTAIPIPGQ